MNKHIHFWVISSPDGSTSIGTCKYCEKRRGFSNSLKNENKHVNLTSNLRRPRDNNIEAILLKK